MHIFNELSGNFYFVTAYIFLAFFLYYFLIGYIKKRNKDNTVKAVILSRFTGVLFFGIIPSAYFLLNDIPIADYGINFNKFGTTLIWTLATVPVILAITFFNSKKDANLKMYPEIRKKEWGKGLLAASGITWLLYLLAYELLFRGFFLFTLYETTNFCTAVVIMTVSYAVVHIPKGMKESLGSLPFGILLGYMALTTGSFLGSFIVHSVMALSTEWFSLKYHPEIHLKA